jgi:hypothetical protein
MTMTAFYSIPVTHIDGRAGLLDPLRGKVTLAVIADALAAPEISGRRG